MRHPLPALGAVALVALAACASGGARPSASSTTSSRAPAPSTVTTFGGVPGAAQTQACLADARSVQQASDFYAASHTSPAPSIDALVTAGILAGAPSTRHGYVIGYDASTGHVSAQGACTVP